MSGGSSDGWKQFSSRRSNATERGYQRWERGDSLWAPDAESVVIPVSPSSAGLVAPIPAVVEESGRKSTLFPYSDLFVFLHGLCKLASRVQKESCSLTEFVETFQIQQYSVKEWNTAFMRVLTSRSTFFYCFYLVVSQTGSYNFFKRHRTDTRRSHLPGLWFQGVVMLCLFSLELGPRVLVLWKIVLAQQGSVWGQMSQLMEDKVGRCSLEGELLFRGPGSWWELPCKEGSDMGARAKHALCTQTFHLRVRLVHGYIEFNMTYMETNN